MDKLQLKLDNVMQPLDKYSEWQHTAPSCTQAAIATSTTRNGMPSFRVRQLTGQLSETHPTNNPNLINLGFSLMHGAIRIGSQARHWIKNIDLSCPSCKQKCNDIHLFLECQPRSKRGNMWKTFGHPCKASSQFWKTTRLKNHISFSDLLWSRQRIL